VFVPSNETFCDQVRRVELCCLLLRLHSLEVNVVSKPARTLLLKLERGARCRRTFCSTTSQIKGYAM
jgi:hypothetical protein